MCSPKCIKRMHAREKTAEVYVHWKRHIIYTYIYIYLFISHGRTTNYIFFFCEIENTPPFTTFRSDKVNTQFCTHTLFELLRCRRIGENKCQKLQSYSITKMGVHICFNSFFGAESGDTTYGFIIQVRLIHLSNKKK